MAAGTENTVSDGSTYSDTSEDAPDAAIYVKNDLTINGSGSLTLTGNSQSALKVKDNLVILAGTLDITAADKGIKGSDSVAIEDGNLTISAKDDAITTEGALSFYNGNLFIKESAEGMEGVQVLIAGGNIDITSSDDGINARGLLEETAPREVLPAIEEAVPREALLETAEAVPPAMVVPASPDRGNNNRRLSFNLTKKDLSLTIIMIPSLYKKGKC